MDVFETAKADEAKARKAKPKAEKPKKEVKPAVRIPGLGLRAALSVVHDRIGKLKTEQDAKVKRRQNDLVVAEGRRLKAKPESFKAFDGDATGTCVLNIRPVTDPLTLEEARLLGRNRIPMGKVGVDTYVINPEYAENAEILQRVSEALAGVEGLPADFIKHVKGKVRVATPESVDAVFRCRDEAKTRELLPLVTRQSITSVKVNGDHGFQRAWRFVSALMQLKMKAEAAAVQDPVTEKGAAAKHEARLAR